MPATSSSGRDLRPLNALLGATAVDQTDAVKPRSQRGRGPGVKSGAVKASILDAALEVFAEQGYRGSSLREIAHRIGTTEAGLLYHFKTKRDLLLAVLERRDVQSLLRLHQSDDEDFVSGIVRVVEYNTSIPGVMQLFTSLAAEATDPTHPAHEYFEQRYALGYSHLVNGFRSIGGDARLHDGITPEHAATMTLAVIDGLQMQWLYDPHRIDMARELRRFLNSIGRFKLEDE